MVFGKWQLDSLPWRTQALDGILDAACGLTLPAPMGKAVESAGPHLTLAVSQGDGTAAGSNAHSLPPAIFPKLTMTF